MLLPVFLLFLCAIATSGIHALAIPAVEATSADSKCIDLTHCRTIWSIIWSSLATIFACTWVFVHRNVPDPAIARFTVNLERLRITAWALLVPEYIVAWAIRQWIVAHEISKEFNNIHARAYGGDFREPAMQTMVTITSQEIIEDRELPGLWSRFTSTAARLCRTSRSTVAKPWDSLIHPHRAAYLKEIFKKNNPWTVTHGFFVLMGGFYYFEGDRRQHPVSREDLEDIIEQKYLMPLSEEATNEKGEGDGFSKTVTVMQTLWFVAQGVARAIQGLTITNLEIVTLAYTAIIMAMYYFWWSKPLNVRYPIRLTRRERRGWRKKLSTFVHAVLDTQDDEVNLWELGQVPTFYAGKPKARRSVLFADAVALTFAMIFGAVHCIAWSFAFPSHAEKLIWRISAVALVGVPVVYMVLLFLMFFEVLWLLDPLLILCTVGIPFYLLARVVLLVLAFATLRDLPPTAYETVHWITFIPHI